MSDPIVSVIIPCHNAAPWVREAIESSLCQTYANKEVIVIDDGSTDCSRGIINGYGKSIRWESTANRGACAARNRGLALAEGAWVQFLDADDALNSVKIARHMQFLERRRVDVSYSDYEIDWRDARALRTRVTVDDGGDPVEMTLRHVIQTSAPLYPRDLLVRIGGFREGLPCAQEYDLNLRLACANTTWGRIPEVLCTVHKVPGGLSRDYGKVLGQYERILGEAYGVLSETGSLTEARKIAFAETLATAASHLVQLGDSPKAAQYYRMAARMHPGKGWTNYRPTVRLLHHLLGAVMARRLLLAVRGHGR